MGSEFASKSKQPVEQKSSSPTTKTLGPLSSTHPVFQLQRTLGNQGVLRLIQSGQLGVSQPGDKHEREVDRVADQVMRMPDSQAQRSNEGDGSGSAEPATPDEASTSSSGGGGQPLPDAVRSHFEPGFGHDFSRIPVFDGAPVRVQPKLSVGAPGDKYEQEADRVAEQVMRMPALQVQRQVEQEEEKEENLVQGKPIAGQLTPFVQRQVEEESEEEILQTKNVPSQTPSVTPGIAANINAIQGGGRPLPKAARDFLEPRFGHDFSQVRIHRSGTTAQSAMELDATAYTAGREIVFGTGKYAPETTEGKRLLAHELAHVMQQEAAVGRPLTGKSESQTNNVHFNSELAQTRNALAVTHRGNIHISERAAFLPQAEFDLIFAHEAIHVAQQSNNGGRIGSTNELESEANRLAPDMVAGKSIKANLRAESSSYLHQNQPSSTTSQPVNLSTNRNEQTQLIDLINQRLHERYGIDIQGADRLTRSRVHLLPGNQFSLRLRHSDIAGLLFTLFRSANRPLLLTNILFRAGLGDATDEELRTFIRQRVRARRFEYQADLNHPLQLFFRGPIHPISPADLVARHVAGYTTSRRSQSARRVFVEMPGSVETLIHEACHFYTSNAFTDFARTNEGRFTMGRRLGSILREGFTEFFTRELMRTYPLDFGSLASNAYQQEYENSLFLIATQGESSAIQAYFHGDTAALNRLNATVTMYEGRSRPSVSFLESEVFSQQAAQVP